MKNINSFPAQKLTLSEKTKQWKEDCVNYIIGHSNLTMNSANGQTRDQELQTYYDLYNSIYNEKDLKYVTNPFKQNDGFPATAQDYNIIKPKIDLLLGEETKRPFNFRVCRTSDAAASELQEKSKQMLMDYIMTSITAKMTPQQQQEFQAGIESGQIQTPPQIANYMSKSYKDIAESTAYHSLRYLEKKLNVQHVFFKGWKDALIAAEEVYYVGIINGQPALERVNPIDFDYQLCTNSEFIHDAQWCVRKMRMSGTEIYDRFYDKMDEAKLNELLDIATDRPNNSNPEIRKNGVDDYVHMKTKTMGYGSNPFDNIDNVDVYHVCWKSFKKIGFVAIMDQETGEASQFTVDETYKKTGQELSLEWDWVVETWEGYMIGENMYLGIQPVQYQYTSTEQPNAQRLPYTGAVYNNTNTQAKSLVAMMKPLQYMYIVIWYRMELAMARDKGKVLNMDITQIPKSMSIDVGKWMHYLSALGVNFINPYECFSPETEVMMGDGSISKIKDIQCGDYVMGIDGTPRRVTAKHNGVDHMYKLKVYTGGDDQIVNSKHLIYYKQKDYYNKTEITKLATPVDLLKENSYKKYKGNIRYLQRVANIDIDRHNDLFIDPYILGLWLGDGFTNHASICTIDKEIIDSIQDYADNNGMHVKICSNKNNRALSVSLANKWNILKKDNKPNPFIEALRHYEIYKHKDIPEDYIYTSEENRLQLLAGLIDTDGNLSKRDNYYIFSQCESRKHIVEKAAFIARSLGFKCTVNTFTTACKKYICGSNNISTCENTVVLNILDGDKIIPCRLPRKQGFVKKSKGNALQSNFKVEYNGIGDYVGITVDNDNLFLLKDFTIVHNCDWATPGRDASHPASFNQITAIDLTMAQVIDQYINLMSKIEDMVSEISGVSKQREGSISSNELVGNVERSVNQSAHITEPWFWLHNQVKKHVLSMLLNTAKEAWKDGQKQNISYVLDDATRIFLQISDNFFYEDFDLFVTDSTKEDSQIQMLKQLMQPAMQNGASLVEAAEIITSENVNAIKMKLQEIEDHKQQMIQQQQEAESKQQEMLQQMQNETKEQELSLKEAELELNRYKIDADNQTKIYVAELQSFKDAESQDANANGIPDPLEVGKQAIEQLKAAGDLNVKQLEQQRKLREADDKRIIETKKIDAQQKSDTNKREIENAKIKLEQQRMEFEKNLQKQKDQAAMDRERLKATTALKNKVTGQK